jgi:hypothetical protein
MEETASAAFPEALSISVSDSSSDSFGGTERSVAVSSEKVTLY